MKISIDLKNQIISDFELSFSEAIVLGVCKNLKTITLKEVCNNLKLFDLKDDSIYRILKKLQSKGLIDYHSSPIKGKNLYLICDEEKTIMKIGSSNNAINRLKSFQVGFYKKLNLVFELNNIGHLEKDLQKEFEKYRLSGEWFVYRSDIIDKFKQLSNGK